MDDLEFLKANVPDFEGYDSEEARHHSDQRVRAWVGSMLADVQIRLNGTLPADVQQALEAAILRCQFPDQTFTTRLDIVADDVTPELVDGLAQVDRQLVELGNHASTSSADALPAVLQAISAAFDLRRQRAPAPPPLV